MPGINKSSTFLSGYCTPSEDLAKLDRKTIIKPFIPAASCGVFWKVLDKIELRQLCILGANSIFLVHVSAILIISLGWLIPQFFYVFLSLLVGSILSDLYFGYCFLTKLEFGLRKRINPTQIFHSSFIKHYAYKFFRFGRPVEIGRNPVKSREYSFLMLLFAFLVVGLSFRFLI